MKKRKKIKKSYSKRNIISKLSNRMLDKDLAGYFEISKTSLYRYKIGQRKIPEFILAKGSDLLNLLPKKGTKNRKLKKKRFEKIEKKLESGIAKISSVTDQYKIRDLFLYTDDYKNIESFILRLQTEFNDGPNVVYRIIRERVIENEKKIDSTHMYSLNVVEKLINKFKKLLSKYAGSDQENDKFLEKIYIERTEYI